MKVTKLIAGSLFLLAVLASLGAFWADYESTSWAQLFKISNLLSISFFTLFFFIFFLLAYLIGQRLVGRVRKMRISSKEEN